jgi:hypothetical protein
MYSDSSCHYQGQLPKGCRCTLLYFCTQGGGVQYVSTMQYKCCIESYSTCTVYQCMCKMLGWKKLLRDELWCRLYQREARKTRGSARTGYWKFRGRRRWSTLHRNPPPPQLEYTSYHSWAALSIGWQYGTSFTASTSTGLSKCIQPAQAKDGMGPASSYTGSLGCTLCICTGVCARLTELLIVSAVHQI